MKTVHTTKYPEEKIAVRTRASLAPASSTDGPRKVNTMGSADGSIIATIMTR